LDRQSVDLAQLSDFRRVCVPWAIRLIARERAGSRRVTEKLWNVSQFPDGPVSFDGVCVIEMEAVLKMICVGGDKEQHEERAAQRHEDLVAQRSGDARKHQIILSASAAGR